MSLELRAFLKDKLDSMTFYKRYFNCYHCNGFFFSNVNNEKLNLRIASEFYEEYVNSNDTIDEYINKTSN